MPPNKMKSSLRAIPGARVIDNVENFETIDSLEKNHVEISQNQIGNSNQNSVGFHMTPEIIRRKQKRIVLFKILGVTSLVCIPIAINGLSRTHQASWSPTAAVMILGLLSFFLYKSQTKLRFQIESACHQLGPGVKLRRKYLKDSTDLYQIFQEGHRYYYVRSLQTGEKRLVPKDKILQDFDLAL